jgi:arylformamidase
MGSQWIDLSQPLFPGMPHAKTHGEFEHRIDRIPVPDPISLRITHLKLATHMGTHIDAAAHFIPNGKVIDQYPISQFTGEGVVVDVRRAGAVPIDVADLEGKAPEIHHGDIVFLYTGYAEKFGVENIHETGHPYLTVEAAQWLVSRGVKLLGMDVFTPDAPDGFRPEGFDWPVHQSLLGNDTLIVENLGPGLAAVAGRRVEIVCVPFHIHDSDGSPVVPLARVIA